MTCHLCDTKSGEYDLRKLCCAVRHVERATRDDTARLIASVAHKHGHDEADIRAGVAELRRSMRKPNGEPGR